MGGMFEYRNYAGIDLDFGRETGTSELGWLVLTVKIRIRIAFAIVWDDSCRVVQTAAERTITS
jgi:hypothetical protein